MSYGGGDSVPDIPVAGPWTQTIPPVNATPDTFSVSVNGANQGNAGVAAPGTQAQLSFTFHDPVNGGNAIGGGTVYLQDPSGTGPLVCRLGWSLNLSVPNDFLFDSGFGSQSDTYCTITQASMSYSASDPSLATMTLNVTFTAAAIGNFSVNSQVWDQEGGVSPYAQVGSFQVQGPLLLSPAGPLLSIAAVGASQTFALAAQGGRAPYTWSIQSGSLPTGLTLSTTAGTITGVPTVNQTGPDTPTFTVALADSAGATSTMTYALPVADISGGVPTVPTKEYIRFNRRIVAIENASQNIQMNGTEVGIFRISASPPTFLLDSNGNGAFDQGTDKFLNGFTNGIPGQHQSGDIPISGDWSGDGHTKIGIYRPPTGQAPGTWFLDWDNSGTFDGNDKTYIFPTTATAVSGAVPVVGNWNGGGKSCIGIYLPNGGIWQLDYNCDGTYQDSIADAYFPFGGLPGDVPVVGAWFGGTTHVGVVRKYAPGGIAQGSPFYWVLDAGAANASSSITDPNKWPLFHPPAIFDCFAFGGQGGDVYVTGDWYNTGTSTAGVFRNGGAHPTDQGFLWVLDAALPGAPQASHYSQGFVFGFGGILGDIPLTGKW